MGTSLRVSLLGLRVQRLGQYQVAFRVAAAGQQSPLLFQADKLHTGGSEGAAARTDVSAASIAPEFANRVFLLNLPSTSQQSLTLTCQLFSVFPQGPQQAQQLMQEEDVWGSTLVAQAALQFSGVLWGRLANGEHVPMALQLQPLLDPTTSTRSRDLQALDGKQMHPGLAGKHVITVPTSENMQEITLQLMLVGHSDPNRAHLQQSISHRGLAVASASQNNNGQQACQVLCHIARATGFCSGTSDSKQKEALSFTVTSSIIPGGVSSAEEAHGVPAFSSSSASQEVATAATAAVTGSTTGHVWNEWLNCDFSEQQRSTAVLQLTVTKEADDLAIARCQVPLASLQLHFHYNLQLRLQTNIGEDQGSLFVTLYMAKCPALDAAALAQASKQERTVLQPRFTGLPAFRDASDPLASWSIETDPKPGPGPAPSYTPVPASDLQRMQMILQQMTQTADKDDDGFLLRHVMPIMFSGSDGPLMHHQVSLQVPNKTLLRATAALVLDLYDCKVAPHTTSDQSLSRSDLRNSAVANLGRLRSQGTAEGTSPASPLKAQVAKSGKGNRPSSGSPSDGSPVSSSNNSSASSRASSRSSRREADITKPGSASTAAASAVDMSTIKPEADTVHDSSNFVTEAIMTPLGRVIFPLRQLSDNSTGELTELEAQLRLCPDAKLSNGAEYDSLVRIEVQAWSAGALAAQLPQTPDLQTIAGNAGASSSVTPPGHASYLVSLLTEDLVAKQSALEQLQRAVLKAEGSSQLKQWRIQEIEKRNNTLAADLSQLRRLLHEEKSSCKAALSVKGWDRLPREELVLRACQAVAAVAREKSRCAELVYRLQQTHEDAIEAKQLQLRFAELQEAHVTQARLVRKLESEKVQSKQTLDTVKSQEGVISKLEGLLKQAMAERRAAVATAEKVQQHVTSLESTIESSQAQMNLAQVELGRLRAFNKYEEIERVQRIAADETEKVRMQLTAEVEAAHSQAAADVEAARSAAKTDVEAARETAKLDVEAAREAAKADVDSVRERAVADVDALRAQYAETTEQLRAQFSADAELARNARFEDVEKVRSEKNAEIAVLRERQVADAELARTQRLAEAEAGAVALRQAQEKADKQTELLTAECEALRSQMQDTRLREDNARLNAEEFESERLAASMRADKAETSAIAAQHELIDVTKRYAREIAMLKTRLAEKDAQLMGGFGALSNMHFGLPGGGLPDPEAIAATLPEQSHPYMRSSWGEAKSWGRPQLHPMPEHALPAMHFQTSQHAQHGHSIKSSTPVRSQDVTAGQQKLHGADRDSMDRLSGALGQPQQAVWSTQASSPGVSGEVQPPLSNNSLQAGAIDNEVQELKLQSQQNEPEQATINRVSAETVSSSEQSSPAKTALQSLSTSRRQLQQLVSLQNSMASLPKQAPGSGEAVDGRSQVQQLPAVQQQKAQPAYSDSATESESELESGSETESDSEAEQQRVQQKAKTKQPTAITVRSTRNSQSLDRQSVRSTRSSEDDQHQSAALQQQMKQQPLSNASPDMVPKNSAQKPAGDKQPAQKTRWNVFAKPAR